VDLSIFDLPTETRKERKIASSFRKKLLDDGFSMLQFSIYMRFCAREKCRSTHQKNKKQLTRTRQIGMMQITDSNLE
jgi:CRISPR-associated protein Cas2